MKRHGRPVTRLMQKFGSDLSVFDIGPSNNLKLGLKQTCDLLAGLGRLLTFFSFLPLSVRLRLLSLNIGKKWLSTFSCFSSVSVKRSLPKGQESIKSSFASQNLQYHMPCLQFGFFCGAFVCTSVPILSSKLAECCYRWICVLSC